MYKTLNKDLYKKLFVGASDYELKTVDLPNIGKKGVELLQSKEINKVNKDNLGRVQSILSLNNKEIGEIRRALEFNNKKVESIKMIK